ncbi:MAG TPA: methyltransferase domain-containing protein [Candidatus Dormibacteraeota bacterium]|nr:methyltransferase domain-containing protein [Candidatus Dormibacteraeota bacterium]
MFEIQLAPGPADVVLVHPTSGEAAGRWRFGEGGALLTVDFLGDAWSMCRVDGRAADSAELDDGFVAWPRMTFRVGGTATELVSRDPEVLRRHYLRPAHQETAYCGPPDPYVEAFHRARLAQLRRLLSGTTGRVLDAGSGYSLVAMAGPFPGLQIVACDRDPGAVRAINGDRRGLAVVGSAEQVPYRPGVFDAVFAGEIVEHLLRPDAALRGWVEALRPGGRLIVTTPNRTHVMARLLDRYEVKNPEHLFEYSPEELLAAVERAGARVTHLEGLQLALPVYLPPRGWRDVLFGVRRRWGLPGPVVAASMRAGRWFPRHAENLAVVAVRRP